MSKPSVGNLKLLKLSLTSCLYCKFLKDLYSGREYWCLHPERGHRLFIGYSKDTALEYTCGGYKGK